jgi:transaldolase
MKPEYPARAGLGCDTTVDLAPDPVPGPDSFAGPDWERLRDLGAGSQLPLSASTDTKSLDHSDILYVSELLAPDVINTMPEQTLRAFVDHGEVARTLDGDAAEAEETLRDATRRGRSCHRRGR